MSNYIGSDILESLKDAKNYNRAVANLVKDYVKEGEVLDFGAGLGTFADLLPVAPTCLEKDKEQTEVLIAKGYKTISEVEERSFDFIYSLNVLEHIEDDKMAVKKLVNGLKKNGRVLIFVPAFNFLFSKFDEQVRHFRRYNKRELMSLFKNLEVDILQARYFDVVGFSFAILFKLLKLDNRYVNRKSIIFFDRLFFPLNKLLEPIFSRFFGKNLLIVVRKN